MTATERNTLLSDDWIVVVTAEVDALPETLADVADPELVGRFEGEMGLPCDPAAHYVKLGEIELYTIGWRDAAANLEVRHRPRAAFYEGIQDCRDGVPCGTFRYYANAPDEQWYTIGWHEEAAEAKRVACLHPGS